LYFLNHHCVCAPATSTMLLAVLFAALLCLSAAEAVASPQRLAAAAFAGRLGLHAAGNNKREVRRQAADVPVVAAAGKSGKAATAPTVSLNAFDLFMCGLVATALGDFIMHPIDTIKVTQQSAKVAVGIVQTAKDIFTKGGLVGFYPGVVPYCTADGLSGAIKFAAFELSKIFVEARVPVKFHPQMQFVCAAGAMLACSLVLVPGEVIKTRLQTGMVSSLIQGITQAIKQDGIAGLFAGYYATMLRDVPYTMFELGLYENIKTLIRKTQKRNTLTQQEELAAAAFTGGFTGFVTTPLDLIKTKLMMQSTSGGGQYKGVADAFSSIYKAGGINGLFVGSAARVAWLLPFTTIYLGIYEACKRQILAKKTKAAAAASLSSKR